VGFIYMAGFAKTGVMILDSISALLTSG